MSNPDEGPHAALAVAGDKDVDIFSANVGQRWLAAGASTRFTSTLSRVSRSHCRPAIRRSTLRQLAGRRTFGFGTSTTQVSTRMPGAQRPDRSACAFRSSSIQRRRSSHAAGSSGPTSRHTTQPTLRSSRRLAALSLPAMRRSPTLPALAARSTSSRRRRPTTLSGQDQQPKTHPAGRRPAFGSCLDGRDCPG